MIPSLPISSLDVGIGKAQYSRSKSRKASRKAGRLRRMVAS